MLMRQKLRKAAVAFAALLLSSAAFADWTVPVPKTSTLSVGDSCYLYNVGMQMFYNQGEAWKTQAIVAGTGLKACVNTTTVADDDGNETTYYYINTYNSKVQAGDDLPTSARSDADGTYVGKGNCAIFVDKKISDNNEETKNGTNCYWNLVEVTSGVYRFVVPSEFIANFTNAALDESLTYYMGCDTMHASNVASPTYGVWFDITTEDDMINWKVVSFSDYETYLAEYETYAKAQELAAAIEKAQAAGVDVSAAQAVYNNTSSTTEQLQAQIDALAEASAAKASVDNPIDMTSYIVNPTFDDNTDGWTNESNGPKNHNKSYTDSEGNFTPPLLATWLGSEPIIGRFYQIIEGLPAGVYMYGGAFRALNQLNNNQNESGAYAYANTFTYPISSTDGEHIDVFVPLVAGESLEIGMKMDSTNLNNWLMMDNLSLTYYGGSIESYQYMSQSMSGTWYEFIDNAEVYPSFTQSYYDAVSDAFDAGSTAETADEAIAQYKNGLAALAALQENIAAWNNLQSAYDEVSSEGVADGELDQLLNEIYEKLQNSNDARTESTEDIEALIDKLYATLETAKINAIQVGSDVTNLLKNPTFSATSTETPQWTDKAYQKALAGWEIENRGTNGNGQPNVQSNCVQIWNYAPAAFYQTIGTENAVPQGVYTLKVQGYYRTSEADDNGFADWQAGTQQTHAWIYMGDAKTYLPNYFEMLSETNYGGGTKTFTVEDIEKYAPNNLAAARAWFDAEGNEELCTVTAQGLCVDGTLTIGFKTDNQGWFVLNANNLQMTYDGKDADVAKNVLNNAVAAAQPLLENDMNREAKNALQSAIDEANSASEWDDIVHALSAISEATDPAQASIAKYAELAAANEKLAAAIEEAVAGVSTVSEAKNLNGEISDKIINGTIADDDIDAQIEEINALIKKLGVQEGEASDDNPIEYTSYIVNPEYEDGNNGWTIYLGGGNVTNGVIRAVTTQFDYRQDITGLPAGTYQITCQGIHRPVGGDQMAQGLRVNADSTMSVINAIMYACTGENAFDNDTTIFIDSVKFQSWAAKGATAEQVEAGGTWYSYYDTDEVDEYDVKIGNILAKYPNDQEAVDIMFKADEDDTYLLSVYATVGGDGQLRIGARDLVGGNNFNAFDNWHLYYLGTNSSHAVETGISSVNLTGKKRYFTSDGRQLNGLQRGLNIIQTTSADGKVTTQKVFIK